MEHSRPPSDVRAKVDSALDGARDFVRAYDPELVVLFGPDHYNGFFYDMMPPFCIGAGAEAVGDFGTSGGKLPVDRDTARWLVAEVLGQDVDVTMSERMIVDHGFAQPLDLLFGGIDRVPVVPVFINAVAEPLGPAGRARRLGEAIGGALAELDQRVLVIGSGGLSHDPPVPRMAEAESPEVIARLIDNRNPSPQERAAREARVIAAAHTFAAGTSQLQPLNPAWDAAFLDVLELGTLTDFDTWTNDWFVEQGGHSAHEVRTWIAAYAALAAQGPYRMTSRFYEPVEAWIAGFALTTAEPAA
ncbi:3-carboxyethylcatechol 2,3-dioxygenase [Streptomyces sp. NPDC047081]|uniref:3-carboxyethylcatechol 2,3-dioxygenase n=1 Tax=Streptomyces sp. NPDC047081 TaxID=3154706 RepID=UPI0033D6FBD7